MKIAIPAFNIRISPRFDNAQNFIVLKVTDNKITEKVELATKKWTAIEKIKKLSDLRVDILICGGIDNVSMQHLRLNNIEVFSWVTGEIKDAVSCFLRGEMASMIILGNGGEKQGKWRFRRRKRNCGANNIYSNFHDEKKEIKIMPKGDGKGPQGQGPRTGKKQGKCNFNKGTNQSGNGSGRGSGRGSGQGSGQGSGGGNRCGQGKKGR